MRAEDDENIDDENIDDENIHYENTDEERREEVDFIHREFSCPYCWETVEPPLEGDLEGELIWDCEVCCRPWLIKIRTEMDGTKSVSVDRAQE